MNPRHSTVSIHFSLGLMVRWHSALVAISGVGGVRWLVGMDPCGVDPFVSLLANKRESGK